MIVFARIEDDKNITGFIVDYDPENPNGISLGEEEKNLESTPPLPVRYFLMILKYRWKICFQKEEVVLK